MRNRFLAWLMIFLMLFAAPTATATEIITSGYMSSSSLTKGQAKQAFEDIVSLIKELVGGTAKSSAIAISGGALAITDDVAVFVADAETGSADNLDNITGAVRDGRVVGIYRASGDTITVRHSQGGAGQIITKDGSNLSLDNDNQIAFFYFNEGASAWYEFGARDLTFTFGKLPGGKASETLTISSGSITPTGWEVAVNNESAASADDLDTLAVTNSVPLIVLKQGTTGKVPTIKHGTGNITTADGTDLDLDDLDKRVAFMLSGSDYVEVFRAGFNFAWEMSSKTSGFTAAANYTYLCDTNSIGAFTATLPAAASNTGKEIEFVKVSSDSNDLTVDGNASETINGATTKALSDQWSSIRIRSDGSNWVIVSETSTAAASGGGSMFKPAMITETLRTLPTSGNISGTYVMKDVAWQSTGALTATGPVFIYANGGSFQLDHTLTATPIDNGGVCTQEYGEGQNGGGLGGGQGGRDAVGGGGAGGGSPAGSDGGKGGSTSATYLSAPGRGYSYTQDLCGSGGGAGGASGFASQFGATGGGGGSSVVIETYNCNVDLNETISVNGGNGSAAANNNYEGSGAGGGAGSIVIRLGGTGTFDLAASKKLSAKGGNGGNADSVEGPGGPGAGGYVEVTTESATLTLNGSIDVAAGTKGSGGTYPATNGEAGVSSTASSTKPVSVR